MLARARDAGDGESCGWMEGNVQGVPSMIMVQGIGNVS